MSVCVCVCVFELSMCVCVCVKRERKGGKRERVRGGERNRKSERKR